MAITNNFSNTDDFGHDEYVDFLLTETGRNWIKVEGWVGGRCVPEVMQGNAGQGKRRRNRLGSWGGGGGGMKLRCFQN